MLATVIAWPIAWRLYDKSGRWSALMLTPLLAPGYLAYAGLGLARAPGTWLGDLLLARGGSWPLVADRTLAVTALALWTWPVACLALCLTLRRVDGWVWEALRLEPASALVRARMRLRAARAGVVSGVILVALLMLGAAIPLHLAGIGTYAIELWAMLASTAPAEQWRVHVSSWPMMVAALAGAWIVLSKVSGWASTHASTDDVPRRRSRRWIVAPLIGVGLSLGVPAALLAGDLVMSGHVEGTVRTFARLHGDAVVGSLEVSAYVLVACLAIGLCVSALEHGARSIIARLGTVCLLVTALAPGVLIGSAMLRGLTRIEVLTPLLDWPGVVAIGQVARFGFLPALIALWMVRATAPEVIAMRRLDGADGVRGWLGTALRSQAPGLVGASLVCAAMSLHEIEVTVMLAPAGTDSLARSMLEWLHFARMEMLTVGSLTLLCAALAAGGVVALLGGFARPWANRRGSSTIR